MDLLLSVVVDGVCVVEPAVIGVSFLAVHEREGLDGLRKLVSVLHLDEVKVTTVSLTSVFLLSRAEPPTLHTLPVTEMCHLMHSDRIFLLKYKCLTYAQCRLQDRWGRSHRWAPGI